MGTATAIAKEVLYPYIGMEKHLDKVSPEFWESFIKGLLEYDSDPRKVFAAVYSLELKEPERVIRFLPEITELFLEGLAEQYVLGNEVKIVEEFHLLKLPYFYERVKFLGKLQSAVTSLERKRLLEEMPIAYAALSGEISDGAILNTIFRNERENLKEKFDLWDQEVNESKYVNHRSFSLDFSSSKEFSMKSNNVESFEDVEMEPASETEKESDSSNLPWSSIFWIIALLVFGLVIWWILS